MKKEDLIAMGFSEEQADALIGKYGTMIPKERFDEVNKAKKTLETQLAERDTQLEELKKIDAEGLQNKITQLQQENEQTKTQYEQQLKDERMSSALKLALAGKVHDADLVTNLIDRTKIELGEDGSVAKGLDEQLKTLQESKSFLFVPEKKAPEFKGWVPVDGNEGGEGASGLGANFAKMANEKGSSDSDNSPWS
ncbi:phage scaffolding protein [Lysinibacillus sp. LZ02]|uniref:phage scaffolding protein n=1 Tax=Lysinibacillus sp. LZ02 TaxID=3420668 RepID=UPI003D366285